MNGKVIPYSLLQGYGQPKVLSSPYGPPYSTANPSADVPLVVYYARKWIYKDRWCFIMADQAIKFLRVITSKVFILEPNNESLAR